MLASSNLALITGLAAYAAADATLLLSSAGAEGETRHTAGDDIVCGGYATGNSGNLYQMAVRMRYNQHDVVTAGANACVRIDCENTSGIYFCNDNAYAVTLNKWALSEVAITVQNDCCASSKNTGNQAQSGKGSIYPDSYLILGYANCNAADTVGPQYYDAPGPNGECLE